MMRRFIIITSIFPPTNAVKKFASIEGWQLVVVGDKKSPPGWTHDNVVYLSPDDQTKFGFKTAELLPWNHYCRKLIGYLYAISKGAELIADSDDDNLPYDSWPELPLPNQDLKTLSGPKFVNIYNQFSDEFVWPRGLPLTEILSSKKAEVTEGRQQVGIWQFLADGDPDVDAIYRLTSNKPIKFNDSQPVVLEEGTYSPFNSQNTLFNKDLFPLLFLPAFVTFRFTDILRGLVAQPILWKHGYKLGFGKATVFQERNPHDYLKDFESEIPVYINSEKVVDIVNESLANADADKPSESLLIAYEALQKSEIVNEEEVKLVRAWIEDLDQIHHQA